jgi:hypothetical protein
MSFHANNPGGNPHWKKGQSANPQGKPKGTKHLKTLLDKVSERLKHKHKIHPVDQLVFLAQQAQLNKDLELAADIWVKLLQYMEPTKKPVESAPEKPQTPEQSREAAEAALKMMEEISDGQTQDNRGAEGSRDTSRLAPGEIDLQAQASSEKDL